MNVSNGETLPALQVRETNAPSLPPDPYKTFKMALKQVLAANVTAEISFNVFWEFSYVAVKRIHRDSGWIN